MKLNYKEDKTHPFQKCFERLKLEEITHHRRLMIRRLHTNRDATGRTGMDGFDTFM